MTTYEVNDDISPFNRVVFIRNRWGDNWFTGSGTIVGNNDILTAAHCVYNEARGGWSDECRIYPSYDPDSSNYSSNYYTTTWRRGYTDWDVNGDGTIPTGDNISGSLAGTEKDIALLSLTKDIGSIYGWMGLKFDFDGGTASKLGHPGKYDLNLYYDEGIIYKHSIDNFFWYNKNDIETNSGDSGGPIYVNSGGSSGYQVVGVHSSSGNTNGNACALNAHSSWLSEEIEANNYLYDKSFATITSANSVNEGSSISFTFKTHKSEENKQYTYTLSGVSSSDFSSNALSGTTTIDENGEATFSIGISADQQNEGTENFTLSIGEKTKSISINDTSTGEIFTLTSSAPTITEGDSGSKNLAFSLTLDSTPTSALTISYETLTTGTATRGDDFTADSGSVTFAAGSKTATVNVAVLGDITVETDETIKIKFSGSQLSDDVTATGTIINDDTAPIITTPSSENYNGIPTITINENTIAVHTYAANETVSWSLASDATSSTDYTLFTINSTTGALSFKNAPDYENPTDSLGNNIYALTVKATNSKGIISDQRLWLTTKDINDTPTSITLSATSFNENIAAASTVATLSTTDDDTSDTHTYSLVTGTDDTDNNSFTIDGSSLKIKASPDYETKSSYKIRIKTTDSGSNTFEKAISLSVTNSNDTPTDITLSTSSINENFAASTTFSSLTTTDQDSIDSHTYSLISGEGDTDNLYFSIDGSNLQFKAAPDYETKSSYNIRLKTTDSGGETYAKAFTLSINDLNEIEGSSLDNRLTVSSKDEYIDGKGGSDIVSFSGNAANYSYSRVGDKLIVKDDWNRDGENTLINIEYLQFNDQLVEESKADLSKTFSGEFSDYKFYNKGNGVYQIKTDSGYDDITGIPVLKFTGESYSSSFKTISAITDIKGTFDQVTGLNTDDAKMFRLYNAAFKRLPDADGLKYWIGKYSSGENDYRAVASSFLVSAEFKQRYGDNVSNAKYVETLYVNVLGRDYDQPGYNYWLGNLNKGLETRYELLLGFAESTENKALFTEMTGFG